MVFRAGPFRSRANALTPTCVESPRIDDFIAREPAHKGTTLEAVRNAYLEGTTLRRFALTKDTDELPLFLSSDSGSRMSGLVNITDGHTETPDPKV